MIDNRGVAPQLDTWLADPSVRVVHRRSSAASEEHLWNAARETELGDTRMLGRLIRWRIPGISASTTFEGLFRHEPFSVLEATETSLVSGLVGRIWTLRRDYPVLEDPDEFRQWTTAGTAKVVFAHWVEPDAAAQSRLCSETRLQAFGAQGRLGLASVRPLIRAFEHLVASDAMAAAIHQAEPHPGQPDRP